MNIAILDDSKEDLRQVKSVISSYYESQNTSADIHLYSSAEAFFTKYIPGFYDLIIMDIYMGSMTGMDAARKLREARDTAALIFISSSDSFAVESYDVQASYYLLKPFDPEKLCRILSTIQFRQSQNSRYIELISDRDPCKDPCQEHPVRGYLPQCSSGTYHRCRHYTLLHNLPEIRRASGGNEMFSLLLQRLYRKYGSHREIHR